MTHSQPRVAALLGITRRAAEELCEKEKLPALARFQVVRKKRAQKRIGFDAGIKRIYKRLEYRIPTYKFVNTLFVQCYLPVLQLIPFYHIAHDPPTKVWYGQLTA